MTDKDAVIQAFVRAASVIPEVQLIMQLRADEGLERVLTVIDAPRLSVEVEHRVYEAELEAMELQDERALVDFRLWNVQELSGPLSNYLSTSRRVLFQREDVA